MKAQFEINGQKITIEASMDTLNEIQGMAVKSSRYCKRKGHKNAAKRYDKWFDGIYKALDAKGYYDRFKD